MNERYITYCSEHNCARVQLYGFDVCLMEELEKLLEKSVNDCHIDELGRVDGLVFEGSRTLFIDHVYYFDESGWEEPLAGTPDELLAQIGGMTLKYVRYVGHIFLGAHVGGDSLFMMSFTKQEKLIMVQVREQSLYMHTAGILGNRDCPD